MRTRFIKAHFYSGTILIELSFGPFIEDNFLFMQNNARPFVSGMVLNYFNYADITILECPRRSADLNPIEYVNDNLREFEEALIAEWKNIPQDTIQNMITSISRSINEMIRSKGGNTSYKYSKKTIIIHLFYHLINSSH